MFLNIVQIQVVSTFLARIISTPLTMFMTYTFHLINKERYDDQYYDGCFHFLPRSR